MGFLSYVGYLRSATSVAGALMLCMVIWFFGPAIPVGSIYPLASVAVRLALIGVVVLVFLGLTVATLVRRRRAAKALEAGISAPASDDSEVLAERLKDALATLKASASARGDYLYSVPWYLIIGPPGAGKTTALVNSGLKFPLAGQDGARAMVEGVGGTRTCDWWFAEDAILIDTAGRYTTQNSGALGDENLDRRSWLAFLDLIQKNRPRQPINGVIVAVSLEDLATQDEAERNAHADAIRARLAELHNRLKITFPVYVAFTKADLISGFGEFFADMREADRRMVWGATFATDDRTRNTVGEVGPEFDLLANRLSEMLPDRLQSEPNQARRSLVFGFPAQFAALREPLVLFLSRVFEPTRYQSTAILRGFYFTSGTQEGTAFDRLIGAHQQILGHGGAVALSGRGRSYFLFDLLKKVIFAEAGWVSANRAAVRRERALRLAALSAIGLVTAAALAALGVSFAENRALVADADAAVEEYRVGANYLREETAIGNADLSDAHSLLLWPLRTLPAGYASRGEETPWHATFGLDQRSRLRSAADETYRRALERSFRSRLILRVEERLGQNLNDPDFVYEALKVYLMLGGERTDDDLVVSWIVRDWDENVYPGRLNAEGRAALEEHLRAMLELDAGTRPLAGLNEPLVRDAQTILARVPLVDRAFARLRQDSGTLAGLSDWILVDKAGADADRVFKAADGSDVATLAIRGFYTFDGFHRAFLDRLAALPRDMAAEEWLLGEAGEQRAVQAQYPTLQDDLLRKYQGEFIAAWRGLLDEVDLAGMVGDAPRYGRLAALASRTSPLRQLVQSLTDETALTREPAAAPDGGGGEGSAAPSSAPLTAVEGDRLADVALRSEPGAAVATEFDALHALVGERGGTPLDEVIDRLGNIQQRLETAALSAEGSEAAAVALRQQVDELRALALRLPEPVSRLVLSAVDDIDADLAGSAAARLAQSFHSRITRACEAIVANHYPFYASERDVPLKDFATLFAPGGLFDRFFNDELAPFVDTSGPEWAWRTTNPLASELSPSTLKEFQRAAEIRDAFFSSGDVVAGTVPDAPSLTLAVSTVAMDPAANSGVLKANREVVLASRVKRSTLVDWPGKEPDNHAAVAITTGLLGNTTRIERQGPWALFRLLDATNPVGEGANLIASFSLGGRTITFELAAETLDNPLTLPALREFRCPAEL